LSHLIDLLQSIFYQDKLGTNEGKALKKETRFCRYKNLSVTLYNAQYGELRCDGQRIDRRCGQISALFAALERVPGGLGVAPLLDFLSAPVALPSSAGIELVPQDRMAEALSSAKAVC
jgi:hypothetical protein